MSRQGPLIVKFRRWIIAAIGIIVVAGLDKLAEIIFSKGFLVPTWEFIKNALSQIYNFSTAPITIPRFLLLLLPILAISLLMFVFWLLAYWQDATDKSDYKNYTQDEFWNIRWLWRWSGDYIEIIGYLCPKCSYEMTWGQKYNYAKGREEFVYFSCEHCKNEVELSDLHRWDSLEEKLKREIRHRIRTGEYISRMKPLTPILQKSP